MAKNCDKKSCIALWDALVNEDDPHTCGVIMSIMERINGRVPDISPRPETHYRSMKELIVVGYKDFDTPARRFGIKMLGRSKDTIYVDPERWIRVIRPSRHGSVRSTLMVMTQW